MKRTNQDVPHVSIGAPRGDCGDEEEDGLAWGALPEGQKVIAGKDL